MDILFAGYNQTESLLLSEVFDNDSSSHNLIFTENLKDTQQALANRSFNLIIADYEGIDGKINNILFGREGEHRPIIITFINGMPEIHENLAILDMVHKNNSSLAAMPGIAKRAMYKWDLVRINLQLREEIVDRKWMEETLKSVNQKFKNLVSNIPGIIFQRAFDKDWTMFFISDEVEKITGYNAPDFVKDYKVSFSRLIHHDDLLKVENVIRNSIAGRNSYFVEYRIINSRGDIRWVHEKGQGIFDEGGNVLWIDGSIFDITERVRAQKELLIAKDLAESATRAKTEFLARMSHEIRTPMNIIAGFTDLALEADSDLARLDYLKSIKDTAEHIVLIVNEILDFSKVEAGHITVDLVNINLVNIIDSVIRIMKIGADKKGLYLKYDYEEGLSRRFRGDEIKIRQILINLIGNAIKFTETGGITVTVKSGEGPVERAEGIPGGKTLLFTVEDTGIGISSDNLDLIFKKYKQAGTQSWGSRGTGLGLAITKKLVELMGGKIWVECTPSKGSRFLFTINLLSEENTLAGREDGDIVSDVIISGPLKILLAEDNPVNAKLVDHMLKKYGHSVITVHNGVEALRVLGNENFDFVIMDIEMPVMDGMTTMEYIRSGRVGTGSQSIPIIILTGYVHPDTEKKCIESGANGLIIKPVKSKELISAIGRICNAGRINPGEKPSPALSD